MRNASQAATWAEARDRGHGWQHKSLVFVRHAWGVPADDCTPLEEWESTPLAARHSDRRPPVGAPCFWKGPTSAGHAALVVDYHGTVPNVAVADLVEPGRIDIVSLDRVEHDWPASTWLGWTTALRGRPLPVAKVATLSAVGISSPYRQGGKVLRSHLRLGRRDSDSVWNLQRALIRKGCRIATAGPTGDYLEDTRKAVSAFQQSQGWSGRDADGLAGRLTVARLGLTWVAD